MDFKLCDLIKVAKRENNTKRSYLYVNPIQGKHIPVSPSLSLKLFSVMADQIEKRYYKERILIIGFAETATAIGSAIACKAENVKYYLNTTREEVQKAKYLFFTESHSHATEQRLVINHLDSVLNEVDRIVFAEDEVTTGNTIEKLVNVINAEYKEKEIKYGIISILNSMSDERLMQLRHKGIVCDCVYHIPVRYGVEDIKKYRFKPMSGLNTEGCETPIKCFYIGEYWNCRVVENTEQIKEKTEKFVDKFISQISVAAESEQLLVIGTEEFMYPAMLCAFALEKQYPKVKVNFHATTRSPIEVSSDAGYPLYNRGSLESLYEKDRNTFIYNLKRYDEVFIITDAENLCKSGLASLVGALKQYENKNITLVKWSEDVNVK